MPFNGENDKIYMREHNNNDANTIYDVVPALDASTIDIIIRYANNTEHWARVPQQRDRNQKQIASNAFRQPLSI